jgi:hypothetical protein
MLVQAYALRRLRQETQKFKVSLGCTARPYLKIKKRKKFEKRKIRVLSYCQHIFYCRQQKTCPFFLTNLLQNNLELENKLETKFYVSPFLQ